MILKKYQYNRNNNGSSVKISGKLKIIYKSWDEAYIKVKGQWIYMCGVVDSKGNTIDFLFKEKWKNQISQVSFHMHLFLILLRAEPFQC